MARKSDRLDRDALLLAGMLRRGPSPSQLMRIGGSLERHPFDCVEAIERLARMPGGDGGELRAGYLAVVDIWLSGLSAYAGAGDGAAAEVIEAFQSRLAALAADLDPEDFLAAAIVLGRSGIAVSPEVEAAMSGVAGRRVADEVPDDAADPAIDPEEFEQALEAVARLAGQDPFAVIAGLAESGYAMPLDAKVAMAQTLCGAAATAGAGLLLLLDPLPAVREAAARSLLPVAGALDGPALRRLITLRNWLPEAERGPVDATIRAARGAGVECAPWPPAEVEAIHGTPPDGSGAQSVLIAVRDGRKRLLVSILAKGGVKEAFVAPITKAEFNRTMAMARREAGFASLSRHGLDRLVRRHLHVGLADGRPPHFGLLEIGEHIGAADWTPLAVDWRAELEALEAALPEDLSEPGRRRVILEQSEFWVARDPLHESWFVEGPQIEAVIAGLRRRDQAVERVFTEIVASGRLRWAEHFTWVAATLRECEGVSPGWENYAVLAAALAGDLPAADIAVLRGIAARSVDAARAR